jgi:uncharacterized protein YndB with AHSA1/START domain
MCMYATANGDLGRLQSSDSLEERNVTHISCRPVDASFLDTAPMRIVSVVDLDASPAKVFGIFSDAESWPKWFHAIHKVEWKGEKPYGIGSVRTTWMTGLSVDEQYFRSEQDHRCSYYVAETSVPLAHAMAEDYLLDEIAPGKTRFTHTMALEPRFVVELGGPFSKMYFESMLKKGGEGLQSYVQQH